MAVETVEMPDFSDPPGYEDEVTEEELLAGTDLVRPDQTAYDQCCLLVWGIPVVGSERIEKLKNVCGKLFALTHPFVSTHFPVDNEGKTKGYCFVEYADPSSASEACKVLDGHHLDKNHTFSAYLLSIMRELVQPPAQWVEPKLNEYVDAGDLWWWLQNQKCMDQFAVQDEGRDGLKLQVYWNAKGQEPYVVNDNASRAGWSEFIFKWSPQGTYLATFHAKGIALWGGEEFRKVLRIEHPGVSYLEFSPRESYIITYAQDDYGRFDNTLRVFDTFTGELKKTFQPTGSSGSGRIYDWPFLKWSHDEKYFAFCRVKGNCINIYNTETFSFETQIELPGLITFEWNPKKNTIAYYCEERFDQNAPAEIGIIEYPSKLKIRAQRIFSVSAANLYWQKEGKYLAANTERYSSRKIKDNEVKLTGPSSHIEVFDCTGKEVSVQTFQLSESFVHFGWEPKGDKFAVLIGSGNKVTPVVYKIDSSRSQPIVFGKLDPGVQLSVVKWAPQGGFLVVYAENSTTGQVLFIDANGTEATRIRLIEHASMNYGEWDPTGRYFVTASAGHGRFETGYRMFTFQGREFFKKSMEGLTRFKWRPRPSIVISEEKCKEINKNMKTLSKKFEEEDRREQDKASKEIIEQRRKFMDEFNKIRRAAEERFAADKAERLKLRDGLDTDSGYGDDDYVEETIEIPLSTVIKPLKEDNTAND